MDLGVVAQPQLDRSEAERVGQLVDRGFQREVGRRRGRSLVAEFGRAGERAVAPVTGAPLASAIATVLVSTYSIATSAPSGRAAILIVCRVSERWPTPVNICGRVRTSLTGRPTTRA